MSEKVIGYYAKSDSGDFIGLEESFIVIEDPISFKNFMKNSGNDCKLDMDQLYSENIIMGLQENASFTLSEESFNRFREECYDSHLQFFRYDLIKFFKLSGEVFVKLN